MKYKIYELINKSGEIEYVGCSVNPSNRFSHHKSKYGNFTGRKDLECIVVKEFDDRLDAYHYEGKLKLENGFEWSERERQVNNAKVFGKKSLGIKNPKKGLKGELNKNSKLSIDKVLKIRELYNEGKHLQKTLAEMFGVKRYTIYRIVNNKNWKHI